jgi:glucan phosphorylase
MEKKEIPGYSLLKALALDMRWSWNHEADKIWEALDQDLWNQTQNPWTVLRTISSAILQQKFEDPGFRTMCEHLLNERSDALSAPSWFSTTHGDAPLKWLISAWNSCSVKPYLFTWEAWATWPVTNLNQLLTWVCLW